MKRQGIWKPCSSSVCLEGRLCRAWMGGVNSQKRERLEGCALTGFNLATQQNPCEVLNNANVPSKPQTNDSETPGAKPKNLY